jgi:hypothetical protein
VRTRQRTIGGIGRALALLLASGLVLAACSGGSVQRALGMSKRSPDEFAVVSRAPLILPPDYELRPPRPGEPRPEVGTTADQARSTLVGQGAAPEAEPAPGTTVLPARPAPATTTSAGQEALLGEAGGDAVDPEIRRRIAEENQSLAAVEDELFTRLLQWREPVTLGATVDAQAETERLRANRSSGRPPTEGDTPTVVERRQSPLGALVEKVF